MNYELERQAICEVGRLLYERNLVVSCDGNISVRVSQDELICTPTSVCKGRLEPAMLVRCNIDGSPKEDDESGLLPSSEIKLHARIYQTRADVGAVVHAHPPVATAFAVCRTPLIKAFLPELIANLGEVPICEFALPGTKELAESIDAYIPDHQAALLANHGAVTWADTLWRAFDLMETVEHAAKIHEHVHILGGGVELSAEAQAILASR